jgi:hypothetical protein
MTARHHGADTVEQQHERECDGCIHNTDEWCTLSDVPCCSVQYCDAKINGGEP